MNATINRLAACPGLAYLATPYSDPDPAVSNPANRTPPNSCGDTLTTPKPSGRAASRAGVHQTIPAMLFPFRFGERGVDVLGCRAAVGCVCGICLSKRDELSLACRLVFGLLRKTQ